MIENSHRSSFLPVQPTVSVVGGRVYSVADSLKLVPQHSRAYDLSQPSTVKTTHTSSDSERRKKMALRDLEKRMEAATAVPSPPDAKIVVPDPMPPQQAATDSTAPAPLMSDDAD